MKGEPLRHDFGDGEVAAYRWINADDQEGGIVAASAVVADSAYIGEGASIGDGAIIDEGAIIGADVSIGYRASIGACASIGDRAFIGAGASINNGASIAADDWHITGGPCGSRCAMWTAVHSREHGLRWWVGCQHGISTEVLLERVHIKHGDNEHGRAYRHAILFVTTHPEYLRRVAAQAEQEEGK